MPITIFFDIAQLISLALIPRQNFINIQGQNPVFACGDLIQLGWQMKCWIFTEIDKMCKMVRSNSIWGLKFVTIFLQKNWKPRQSNGLQRFGMPCWRCTRKQTMKQLNCWRLSCRNYGQPSSATS